MRTRILAVALVASLFFILPIQPPVDDAAAQSAKATEACDESNEAISNPCANTGGGGPSASEAAEALDSGSCCGNN